MKEQKEQDLQKKLDQFGNKLNQVSEQQRAVQYRKYEIISALCSGAGAVVMAMILFGNVDDMSDAILIPLLLANMIAGAVWGGTMGDKEVEKGFFIAWGSSFVPCLLSLFIGTAGEGRMVGAFISAVLFPVLLACLPWFLGAWLGGKICVLSSKK